MLKIMNLGNYLRMILKFENVTITNEYTDKINTKIQVLFLNNHGIILAKQYDNSRRRWRIRDSFNKLVKANSSSS